MSEIKNESDKTKSPGCCCGTTTGCKRNDPLPDLIRGEGTVATAAGEVPRISTRLGFRDRIGALKVRWSIGRMKYRVRPGLYAVGNPDAKSEVLVTANYKLSFDSVRRELSGRDAWILVLDTNGINVWCAAGKGTFGTEELVRRVEDVGLERIVFHRKLILPQLGAPGVAAHEVQNRTGFRVIYGPVKAGDLKAFLDQGMKATPEMRRANFGFRQRLTLVPEEIIGGAPILLIAVVLQALLSFLTAGRLSFLDFVPLIGAVLAGSVLVPMFLPWIPGRAFAFKGWLAGVLWTLALRAYYVWGLGYAFHWKGLVSGLLLLPAISAYVAMNFTGSSNFTSLSGVVKEMRRAVPLIVASASLYVVFMIVKSFARF